MEVSKINDDMWKIKTVVLTILLLTKCTWSCTYSWMDHLWESLTGLLTFRKRHRGEKTWTQRRSLICSKSETTGGVCGLVLPSAPTNNPKQTKIRVEILSCDPTRQRYSFLHQWGSPSVQSCDIKELYLGLMFDLLPPDQAWQGMSFFPLLISGYSLVRKYK